MQTLSATTRYGLMYVPATDNCVGRSLVEYGEWSQSEIDLLEQVVKPGTTVLDIGANVGYHTLAMSKAVGPRGKVIAFEPQPEIFQLLAANIAINNLDNVTALNMALGTTRGFVDMPNLSYNVPNNFGAFDLRKLVRDSQSPISNTPITLQRLDEIAIAQNVSFMKMDVEGMELAVLKGATRLLDRRRPGLLLENNAPGKESQELLQFLMEIGYESYWQVAFSFNENNFKNNINNIFGGGGSLNVFSIPREFVVSIEGLRKIDNHMEHLLD